MAEPESNIRLMDAYFDKEPPVMERIERITAEHACMFANANKGKNSPTVHLISFLPHLKAWTPTEVSDSDFALIQLLQSKAR